MKNPCLSEKFEVQEELPRTEKCGVARAVEPTQAESSPNAASELSAHQMGAPAAADVAQSSAESKNTSDREQNTRKGRPRGIRETKPRPSLKRHERASYDTEPHLEPGFLVAYSHKLRCLHYIGRCWRKPGRDIKRWTYFGDKQPMVKDRDHFCQHCWKRGEQPEQVSELAAQDEDSGSSSTDA